MTWAKPADLLIAYKFSTESDWRQHIETLKDWGYPYLAQLEKERARAKGKGSGRQAANGPLGGAAGEGIDGD